MMPISQGYTIYTKQDCFYCDNIKKILEEKKDDVFFIPCDDMITNDRDAFLRHMDSLTGVEHRTFPFVFHNGVFIGGCDATIEYLEKQLSFTEDF